MDSFSFCADTEFTGEKMKERWQEKRMTQQQMHWGKQLWLFLSHSLRKQRSAALQAAYLTLALQVKGALPAYFIKIPLHQLIIILCALIALPLQHFQVKQ